QILVFDRLEILQRRVETVIPLHRRRDSRVWRKENPVEEIGIEDAGSWHRRERQRDDNPVGPCVARESKEIVQVGPVDRYVREDRVDGVWVVVVSGKKSPRG